MGCSGSLPLDGPYDPNREARHVRAAVKGFGTDEDKLVLVLTRRTREQRMEIVEAYHDLFKRDMIKDIIDDLQAPGESKVCRLFEAMLMDAARFDALEVRRAVKGLGTNEAALIEILVSRDSAYIERMKQQYEEEFKRDMIEDVRDDTSGDFRKMLTAILECKREREPTEDHPLNMGVVRSDAERLYKAGERKWIGADRKTFIEIFSTRSFEHLREVWKQYSKISDSDVEKAAEKELKNLVMADDFMRTMVQLVQSSRDPEKYFVKRLEHALSKKFTTDVHTVIRVFCFMEERLHHMEEVFNREVDMGEGKTLRKLIHENTRGIFEKALISLLDHSGRNEPKE